MEQLNNPIGSNIRKYRLKRGWTQEELAQKASEFAQVSRSHLANFERGKFVPSEEVLEALALALDITSFDLEYGDPDNEELETIRILIKKTKEKKIKWLSSSKVLNDEIGLEANYDISVPQKLKAELFGSSNVDLFYAEYQNSKFALTQCHFIDYSRELYLYAEIGDRKTQSGSDNSGEIDTLFAYLDRLLDTITYKYTSGEVSIFTELLQDLEAE